MMVSRILLVLMFAANLPAAESPVDSDRDGLPDSFEQELLVKFAPKFMVSVHECDGLPAEFRPDIWEVQMSAKNGTIYGQVFKTKLPGKSANFLELHYYHLWDRDCGRNGHSLDAEHVSALISSSAAPERAAAWKADYWYAAAHEDTVCDSSHMAKSNRIGAELEGPSVWISSGKHASFLSRQLCRGGCGGDNCESMLPMPVSRIINLGELFAPMNGSFWIHAPNWSLAQKMKTDFPEQAIESIERTGAGDIVSFNESQASIKTAILVGGSTTGALAKADTKTNDALEAAAGAVNMSMDKSSKGVGNSLKRSAKAFWKAIEAAIP